MSELPRVLFVTYGGGHVSMVLPVMQALAQQGAAKAEVLALTSAAKATRAAGFTTWQFHDFLQEGDAQALAWGDDLAHTLDPGGQVEPHETRAYLGLSFQDLVHAHGLEKARSMYAQYGRHCFLPVPTLRRIITKLRPDAVVVTNSPRAERAAGVAARELGVKALCINSMFAIDEIAWLGQPDFCDVLCVLNEGVRQRFVAAGRKPDQVVVTGNPSFDALVAPNLKAAGKALRGQLPTSARQVLLWASQPESVSHPTAPGLVGDPNFPRHVMAQMLLWAKAAPGRHLLIRPHPNEHIDDPELPYATMVPSTRCEVAVALHASDAMATMTSTVALEGHALGLPVLQVRGSIFDHSMPLASMGLARECTLPQVPQAVEALFSGAAKADANKPPDPGHATDKVLEQLLKLLGSAAT
jgi:hypothetical protein